MRRVFVVAVGLVVSGTLIQADVNPLPAWTIVASVVDAIEHDSRIYFGGGFRYVYRPNTTYERALDSVTGEIRPGCARRTDTAFLRLSPDGVGGFFVALDRYSVQHWADANGAFQPAPLTKFIRIRSDCSLDRAFQPPAVEPANPAGSIRSMSTLGSRVFATTSAANVTAIAAYDATSGTRLLVRNHAAASTIDLLGPGAPGTLVGVIQTPASRFLAYINATTLEVSAQGPVVSSASNLWYRNGRVFVWEVAPENFPTEWVRPLLSFDAATLQPSAGWSNPQVGAIGDESVTDLEFVGTRLFVAGIHRVNLQSVPVPTALNPTSGLSDPTWNPPALAPFPGEPGAAAVDMLATDGTRLYFSSVQLGRVGSADRVVYAALNATTGELDPWAPRILNPSGGIEYSAGGIFLPAISGRDGQARTFLAAVDVTTGELTDWNPYRGAALTLGAAALATDSTNLYVSFPGGMTIERVPFSTGVPDVAWRLALTGPVDPMARGARALMVDAGTLYIGGNFQTIRGASSLTSFPSAARGNAAAVSLTTHQLAAWNPNVMSGSTSFQGVRAMTRVGGVLFLGGTFTTPPGGLLGVDMTSGSIVVPPSPGLTRVTALASDGLGVFGTGVVGSASVLGSFRPGGSIIAVPFTFSSHITHFRGRLYATRERDDLTLEPTPLPLTFSEAWSASNGILANHVAAQTAGQFESPLGFSYHPFAQLSLPTAPENLAAQVSDNTVTLGWLPSTGLPTSYVIRAGSGPGLSDLADVDTGSIATTLRVSAPTGIYFVRVYARNALGISPASNEIRVVVGTRCEPPAAPTNLAHIVSGLSVTLSWSAAAGATSYQLRVGSTSGGSQIVVANVGGTTVLTAPAPPGVYFVGVIGVNGCGESAASNEVVFTVSASPPGAPTNLTVALTGNTVALSWSPPSGGGATGYILEVGTASGRANLGRLPFAVTALSAAAPDGTYFVRVRAVNGVGESPPSNEVRIVVP